MPRARGPRHAAPRSSSRRKRLLAAALAITTGLLSALAAAPAGGAWAHDDPDESASLTLDLVLMTDDGSSATGDSVTLSASALDGSPALAGSDTEVGRGSRLTSSVEPGDYVLALSVSGSAATGHTVGSWSCDDADLVGDVVTVDDDDDDAHCTVVVDDLPATLTLLAAVVVDDGGTLDSGVTLTATGAVDAPSGVEGAPSVTGVAVDAGAYAVGALPIEGHAVSGVACWSDHDRAVPLPVDGDVVVLANGGTAVCEVTVDDLPRAPDPAPDPAPARLTLDARAVNDHGGGAVPRDWALRAQGPIELAGAAGSLVDVAVEPGAYALSARGPAGYRALGWSCSAGGLVGSTLTLEAGDSATCVVVHDDLPVDLAVTLDDGGARAANGDTFTLAAAVRNVGARDVDRGEPVSLTVRLPSTVSVVAAPASCTAETRLVRCGIEPTALAIGRGIDLALTVRFEPSARAGVHGAIAFVHTLDDPAPAAPACPSASNSVGCEGTELRYPTITLVQSIVADDGGEATLDRFALSASGPAEITGASGSSAVTVASVPAGTYRLGASGLSGYAPGSWTCVGATLEGDAVTIVGVVDVTCTIAHDDHPVDLQLAASSSGPAPAGGEARLSLVVTNAGARDVDAGDAVTATLALAAGLTHLDGPAGCSAAAGTITCVIDPAALPAGGSTELELLIAVAPTVRAGTLESRAMVTTDDDAASPGGCEAPSGNVVCVRTDVVAGTVSAEKSAWEQVNGAWVSSDGLVGFGDLVQFRVLVRAAGEAPSTGVGLVDRLPSGLLRDGLATCSVPCTVELDAATGAERVVLGTMEPGAVVTVTITARVPGVPSQAEGTTVRVAFDAEASLSSDNVESAPTNRVTVRASHALPERARSGGTIPIGGISVALALLVAGGLLLVRSRELAAR